MPPGDPVHARTPAPGFPLDTSREALRAQIAAVRSLSVAQRIALMDDLTMAAQALMRAGIRRRYPGAPAEELERYYFELTLGRELATTVLEHRRQHPPSTGR